VVIVGGSLNGLTTALLLAHRGVHCTVVERHPATTVQYKLSGISPRSMEIFRGLGIEDEIRAHRTGDQKSGEIARARNLADPDVTFLSNPWADTSQLGAAPAATCDQDRLEPILRAHAERLGADMRFHSELVDIEPHPAGIRVRIRDLATGRDETIDAAYLVAADGVSGRTREQMGVVRTGPGVLQHWMNLIFRTDLEPVLRGRRITSCFVTDVNGSIVPRADRWLLAVQYQPERGERPEDFGQTRTAELVRRAAGRDDVEVELFDARSWQVAAYVTERFQQGRVLFVGDAAHAMPPPGGFGGNTGIHDAHNLAWKLAFVLNGTAGPALLESYDTERRFVAERTLAQALARLAAWFKDPANRLPAPEPIVEDVMVIFGQRYPTGALIAEGEAPAAGFEDPRHPSGCAGSRAPHFVLERAGRRSAIHDHFNKTFTLLVGAQGQAWSEAAAAISEARSPGVGTPTARPTGRGPTLPVGSIAGRPNLELPAIRIGGDAVDVEGRFSSSYGIGTAGAVLVRPDGFIAWRSPGAVTDPVGTLRDVLSRILDIDLT
jgi:2-polyprenyl-6-methoxyphenol hydroxylase-like FAD-dependent oxidoreductase